MFDGQSLGYTPFIAAQAYPAKFMALARPRNPYVVANLPATTYAQRETSVKGRVDYLFPSAQSSTLIDDGGSYDIEDGFGDMTTAQLLAAKAAYTAARRAAGADRIIGLTIPPASILTAGEETIRNEVNAALVASPTTYGYDKIINLGLVPGIQNTADASIYYDGLHWTDAGTTLVAQALVAQGA